MNSFEFSSQHEYEQCLVWINNGSCLLQRMRSAPGAIPFEIPAYWQWLKSLVDKGFVAPKQLDQLQPALNKLIGLDDQE